MHSFIKWRTCFAFTGLRYYALFALSPCKRDAQNEVGSLRCALEFRATIDQRTSAPKAQDGRFFPLNCEWAVADQVMLSISPELLHGNVSVCLTMFWNTHQQWNAGSCIASRALSINHIRSLDACSTFPTPTQECQVHLPEEDTKEACHAFLLDLLEACRSVCGLWWGNYGGRDVLRALVLAD